MTNVLHAPHMTPVEDPFVEGQFISEQAQLLEHAPVSPAFAYEVGHNAVGPVVEADAASIEAYNRHPEARATQIAAETWQSYSPFRAENVAMFGSEAERQEAMATVRGIAAQATLTGKHLNGRHKHLDKELAAGNITADEHADAVGEIAAVMAMTKPAHLQRVGEAQRASIERRIRGGQLPAETQVVDITSRATAEGVELAGIDAVVARMTGAKTQAEVAAAGLELKKLTYREDAYAKATARHEANQDELRRKAILAAEHQIALRRTLDLIDETEKNNDKKAA